jgi:WD40 repeat protein
MLAMEVSTNIGIWNPTTGEQMLTLKGARGRVVFRPDGAQLASGSVDKTKMIRVWDLKSGNELYAFSAHWHPLTIWDYLSCLAYSRDGRYLALSAGVMVNVWDTETREEVHQFRHAWNVDSIAFAPDDRRLITVGPRGMWGNVGVQLKLWDLTSSQEALLLREQTAGSGAVEFSPDGRHLASTHDKTLTIWDLATRQPSLRLMHETDVYGLSYNHDGRQLAAARSDGKLTIWDAATGKVATTLGGQSATRGVAFSPDGEHVASVNVAGVAQVQVWDVLRRSPLGTFTNHSRYVSWLMRPVYSPDGKHLAVATEQAVVCLLDATTGEEQLKLAGHSGYVSCVAFSPDGKRLASTSSDGPIKLWDIQTGLAIHTIGGDDPGMGFQGVAFSPDGQRLAATTGISTKLFDLSGHELLVLEGGQMDVSFSPDGRRLAAVGRDGAVCVWDTAEPSFETMPEFVAAYEACSKSIADRGSPIETKAEALLNRSRMLRQMKRPAEAHADFLLARGIPQRDPKTPPNLIDLTLFYNGGFQRNWFGDDPDNDLASLPTGMQTLAGVPFDVRGLVQLRGEHLALGGFPAAVRTIPIGRYCRSLHVLHGTIGTNQKEQGYASSLVINYDSNIIQTELLGRDVFEWQTEPPVKSQFNIAWTGTNSGSKVIYLYKSTWNVRPHDRIRSVAFGSGPKEAAPFLIAITAK